MDTTKRRPGGLAIVLLCMPAIAAGQQDVHCVQTRVFDIEYEVNAEAMPLESVVMWYTADAGASWHQFGPDQDRQSPMSFSAPSEGRFGFYFIVSNTTGSSSLPPTASTIPHLWAYVDYTPPVIQIHPIRQTNSLGRMILQIRWTAIDAHLTQRPIEIAYKKLPAENWLAVRNEPFANTGRYDWAISEDLTGPIVIRVTVTDGGGHRVSVESEPIEVRRTHIARAGGSDQKANTGGDPRTTAAATVAKGSDLTDGQQRRVQRLFAEATQSRDRGELREAISRMRTVLSIDPKNTKAFVEIGEMLYLQGDLERALDAYTIAMNQAPNSRSILMGTSRIERRLYRYDDAANRLRTILRYNPNDAEVWMHLGDLAVLKGDGVLARECYRNAVTKDPGAVSIIDEAQKRIALMNGEG